MAKATINVPVSIDLSTIQRWMESSDIVEVVRCKDCRYYEETDAMIGTCLLTTSGAEVKGYCAWAERRTDDTD